MGVFLLILSAAFLAAAQHPFLTYPWSLRFLRPRRPATAEEPGARPSVAVCVCAYNEEAVIGWKAESLIAMAKAYGPAEVLVYVDGAADRTAEILRGFSDRLTLVDSKERLGKSAGMARLVDSTRSELLAFTDANVETPVNGLVRLAAAFADPSVGCATATLTYSNPEETAASASGALYWSLEETIKARESDTIGVVGVDGAFFMMRRTDYEPPPPDIIDDLYVSLAALASGRAVVSAPDVVVRERGAVASGEEFKRKARISCQAVNVHRLMWSRLRRMPPPRLYGYVSHRLLKWLTPYALLLSALCGALGLTLLVGVVPVLALAGLAGGVFVAALTLRFRPAQTAVSHLVSLAGVGLGVFESLVLGKRYVTWSLADSVRG